jgi:hypothetical protein
MLSAAKTVMMLLAAGLISNAHAAGESPERCAYLKDEVAKEVKQKKRFEDALKELNCGAGNPSEGIIAECDRRNEILGGINLRLEESRRRLANSSCGAIEI